MFERWTERARQVAVLAQEEARNAGHDYVGTEHILLGLLREEEGLAAQALEHCDVSYQSARAEMLKHSPETDKTTTGQIPFTPRAQRACELALREALSLGHNYIGTEHLLLSLIRENSGVGAKILLALDADSELVRNEVTVLLTAVRRSRAQSESETPGTRLDQRIVDALPDLRRAAGKLEGNAEIVVREATRNGHQGKPLVVIRRGPDGKGRVYTTGEVLSR